MKGRTMPRFDLQYNSRSNWPTEWGHPPEWKHSRRRDTREELEKYTQQFTEEFIQWRIVEVQEEPQP
jgi:hypothetical protein